MILDTFPTGPLQSNCTILGDEESGEAIVVDPGDEAERIHQRLIKHGLKLKQILLTHAHLDHVGGAFNLKKMTGAPIYMNENDQPLLDTVKEQARWLGMKAPEIAPPDESLFDGRMVGLERYPAQVLCTPGHTQGGVCFYIASLKLLIAGDTLFAGGIGRTDLAGGDYSQIVHSIQSRLFTLPEDTKVITGHGPSTTIGYERRSNPYVRLG